MKGSWAAAALGVPAAVLVSLSAAEFAVRADAAAPTVVLLRPTESNELTTEALVRVKGELEAAGFDVVFLPLFEGGDAKRELETAGQDRSPVAAFALFVAPAESGASIAEIWVSDRVRQKTVIQRTTLSETDPARGSVILAVRAVELLKVNLAGYWAPTAPLTAPSPAAARPAPLAPPRDATPIPRAPFASGLGAGVGVGAMESFGAMGVSWAPDIMVSYGWSNGWGVRAHLLGLGPSTTLSATQGTARIDAQLATIEVTKAWWPRAAVVPFLFAGAGAQHDHVVGTALLPYLGHSSDNWSFATSAGVGVGVPVVSVLSFLLQAGGVAAWPSSTVNIANAEVGRVGAPALVVDGGLMGVLP